jgi:hypothetical protein
MTRASLISIVDDDVGGAIRFLYKPAARRSPIPRILAGSVCRYASASGESAALI